MESVLAVKDAIMYSLSEKDGEKAISILHIFALSSVIFLFLVMTQQEQI